MSLDRLIKYLLIVGLSVDRTVEARCSVGSGGTRVLKTKVLVNSR